VVEAGCHAGGYWGEVLTASAQGRRLRGVEKGDEPRGRPHQELTEGVAAAEDVAADARQRIRVQTHQPRLIGLWDPVRLARVVENLVANAVKFSPDRGEVTLEVEPEADQPHIFERFRRGANVVGRIAGTGIGLAGAWQIVQQHGGSIEASSQEGRGSTFTVRLPLLVD
jgi:signal transduction histidine kinase